MRAETRFDAPTWAWLFDGNLFGSEASFHQRLLLLGFPMARLTTVCCSLGCSPSNFPGANTRLDFPSDLAGCRLLVKMPTIPCSPGR